MLKRFLVVMFLLGALGLVSPAFAYEVNLTVPIYGKDLDYYGGPASAQMIMNSYPPPGTPAYYDQSVIWASIIIHNSGEPGWATDPEGMQGALLELNPPPAGTWSIKSYDVKEDLMFQVLYWMNRNSYAVTTLVDRGRDWVVIVGYETDIEPVAGSDPELLEITINDPSPIGSGQVVTMPGTTWYATRWHLPVGIQGTWFDKYVAVIEPPVVSGTVRPVTVDRRGTTLITAAEALQYSESHIDQMDLSSKDSSYAALRKENRTNYTPMMVREGLTSLEGENEVSRAEEQFFQVYDVPYYFIIPYKAVNSDYVKACVVVNAFSGVFEEVGSFHIPIEYISKDGALKKASEVLKAEKKLLEANLVFDKSCHVVQSRITPFWEIVYKEKKEVVYVDQLGKVYHKVPVSLYGR